MTTDRDEVIKTMKSMDGYKSGYEKFPSELSLKAQKSCHEYNKTAPDETEKYHKILGKLYFKIGGIFLLTAIITGSSESSPLPAPPARTVMRIKKHQKTYLRWIHI